MHPISPSGSEDRDERRNGYCDLDERAHGASLLMALIETPCWLRAIGQISLNSSGDIAV